MRSVAVHVEERMPQVMTAEEQHDPDRSNDSESDN